MRRWIIPYLAVSPVFLTVPDSLPHRADTAGSTFVQPGAVVASFPGVPDVEEPGAIHAIGSTSDSWTSAPNMHYARVQHQATLLPSGKVLVTGGLDRDGVTAHASAEIYDPAENSWRLVANMHFARASHTATLLSNGKVLVAGGWDRASVQTSAEVYDAETNKWSLVASGQLG